MNKLLIAMVAHEVNAAYCRSIGDSSQAAWKDAPEWQRNSAMAGVEAKLAEPELTPEQMHEKWMAHKLAEGWKLGPVKDPAKKEHPCLVAYSDLPEAQRIKDHLFSAVVTTLSQLTDEQLMPPPRATQEANSKPASAGAAGFKGLTAVQYIGKRETYREGAYQSGLVFAKGETKLVPAALAAKLLKHPDVYALGELPDAQTVEAVPVVETKQKRSTDDLTEEEVNEIEDAKRALGTMNRRNMSAFAKQHFGRELDPEKLSAADMRTQIGVMIDQFGLNGSQK